MGKGLFMTNWEAFMGYEYAEKERECLRLSECGLRGMNHSLHTWAVLVEIHVGLGHEG